MTETSFCTFGLLFVCVPRGLRAKEVDVDYMFVGKVFGRFFLNRLGVG